jgi:hypothetical protein
MPTSTSTFPQDNQRREKIRTGHFPQTDRKRQHLGQVGVFLYLNVKYLSVSVNAAYVNRFIYMRTATVKTRAIRLRTEQEISSAVSDSSAVVPAASHMRM